MDETPLPSPLPVWLLTLPHVTRTGHDACEWANPDTWPGDWQIWRNKYAAVVSAKDEMEARFLAATDDCAIWLDGSYASAEKIVSTTPGVILSAGGSAENE